MSILERFGTRFWPTRSANDDWLLDLEEASFGPLRLGTSVEEVKKILGRPSKPTWFSTPAYLWYSKFNLVIGVGSKKTVDELEVIWEEEGQQPPELTVRLGQETLRPIREITEDLISSTYGAPSMVDREKGGVIEWLRLDDCLFVDLSEDGRIVGLGFMTAENASK
jgi:hypothetical protein